MNILKINGGKVKRKIFLLVGMVMAAVCLIFLTGIANSQGDTPAKNVSQKPAKESTQPQKTEETGTTPLQALTGEEAGPAKKAEISPDVIEKKMPSYAYNLKQLIKEAEKNIKKVDEDIRQAEILENNKKREIEVRDHFEHGNQLYSQGKPKEAKQEWEQAINITKDPEMKDYVKAAEKKAVEEEKKAREEQQKVREEQARLEREQKEKARLNAEKKRQEELATKKAEEAKQAQLEKEQREKERLELKKKEEARREQERLERQKREEARIEAEKKHEAERKAREEQARLERAEKEKARIEAEKKHQEELANKRAEEAKQAQLEKEQREKARLEAEKKRQEDMMKREQERKAREEQARLEREKKEKERLEAEKKREEARIEAEKKHQEELATKKAEEAKQAQLEKEQREKERLELKKKEEARRILAAQISGLYEQGIAYYDKKEFDKAKEAFSQIVALDQNQSKAKYYLDTKIPNKIKQLEAEKKRQEERNKKAK